MEYQSNYSSAANGDDQTGKIFVGGLSWETTVDEMRSYFSKYGDVVDCTLKTDQNTGRSRGFGFVTFGDPCSVDNVVAEKNHSLGGKTIDPKPAKSRGERGGGGGEDIKKVFVGGLDPSVPESDIREHFGMYGQIEDISLPFDRMKNQRKAYCFITFASGSVVDRVCENAKQIIGGKEVDVKKATQKPDGQRGGFGARGGGGRGGGRGGRGRSDFGSQGYDYNGYQQGGYGGGGGGGGYQGGYDYSNYYNNAQGWSGYGQQGGYDSAGYGGGWDQSSYGKQKSGRGGQNQGYYPY